MSDFREQWNKVDMDFLGKFLKLHNQVCFKKKTQEDFNNFVIDNKDKFDNPDYLQVFAENVKLFSEEFYRDNFGMCKVFYDFMISNPDWTKLDFGIRAFIRLGSFEDSFKEFLEKNANENKVN